MDELLQKHGCANVFSVPEGLKELMSDISREVLRAQPTKMFDFIANYLSALMLTREHGLLATKLLEDLCDCKPTISEHLMQLGIEKEQVRTISEVIQEEIEDSESNEGKEKVNEYQIVKKILTKTPLDEDTIARVCQVARNAYKEYWRRKKTMEREFRVEPEEPWEIAAQHTLELYKKTAPSMSELVRATQKIQAAYRGYYVRRNLLGHLKPKPSKTTTKMASFGPPVDVADSREIDLGPVIDMNIQEDNVEAMFDEYPSDGSELKRTRAKSITYAPCNEDEILSQVLDNISSSKSILTYEKSKELESKGTVEDRQILDGHSEKSHQSRLLSHSGVNRQSITPAQSAQEISLQKISFVEAPPEVIPDNIDDYEDTAMADTIEEEIEDITETQMAREAEVPEDVKPEEIVDREVPEDITDDRTDVEGDSTTTASILASAPDTANNTDVEDDGELAESTDYEVEEEA